MLIALNKRHLIIIITKYFTTVISAKKVNRRYFITPRVSVMTQILIIISAIVLTYRLSRLSNDNLCTRNKIVIKISVLLAEKEDVNGTDIVEKKKKRTDKERERERRGDVGRGN